MKCPKCSKITLQTKQVKNTSTKLDCCPSCKGLWFDAGEIAVILNKKVKVNTEIPSFANLTDEVCCPKCHVKLYEFCYPGTMTLVDVCKTCNGLWLDNLEWKEIREDLKTNNNLMTCPKCSREQKTSDSCAHCGVIIAKYHLKQASSVQPTKLISQLLLSRFLLNFQPKHQQHLSRQHQWE